MSEPALRNSKNNNPKRFVVFVAIVAGLGGLLFGFDTGIIADTQDLIVNQYTLSTIEWSMIVSITVLGAFIGAIFSGKVADLYGRRRIILSTALGFMIGTLILVFAQGFYSLLLGRLILGICIGIASYAAPLFISEIAPKNNRGSLVLLNSIAITGGEAVAFLVGYFLHDLSSESWRIMFLTGLLPAVLLLVGMFFMPRSPRWVAKHGKFEAVLTILRKIRSEKEATLEFSEIKKSLTTSHHCPKIKELFSKTIRPVIIIGLALGILQQLSGINTIMYYGPHIFENAGFGSATMAIFATFIMGIVNTIATIIVVFIVDKVGRRKLLLIGTSVAFVCLLVIAMTFNNPAFPPTLTLALMGIYIFAYAISLGSMFWLIISEIYPTEVRGMAMSFVASIQWMANFVVALAFLPVAAAIGGIGHIFYIFAFMCLLAVIFSYIYVPETKGVSLELIEKNLEAGVRSRDLGKDPEKLGTPKKIEEGNYQLGEVSYENN